MVFVSVCVMLSVLLGADLVKKSDCIRKGESVVPLPHTAQVKPVAEGAAVRWYCVMQGVGIILHER